uniref:Telomerase reverse transcriptase n=1 Tax=Heterorhabditis bacteriophora TaxID=37862 RepID=A0A1I7X2M0_HETBA
MPKKTDRYRRIMDLAITRPAQELVLNCHTGHVSNYTSDVKRSRTADLRAKTAPLVTALLRHAFKQTLWGIISKELKNCLFKFKRIRIALYFLHFLYTILDPLIIYTKEVLQQFAEPSCQYYLKNVLWFMLCMTN